MSVVYIFMGRTEREGERERETDGETDTDALEQLKSVKAVASDRYLFPVPRLGSSLLKWKYFFVILVTVIFLNNSYYKY